MTKSNTLIHNCSLNKYTSSGKLAGFSFKEVINSYLICHHGHWWIGGSCWRHIRAEGDLGGVYGWAGRRFVYLCDCEGWRWRREGWQETSRGGGPNGGVRCSVRGGNLGRPKWGVHQQLSLQQLERHVCRSGSFRFSSGPYPYVIFILDYIVFGLLPISFMFNKLLLIWSPDGLFFCFAETPLVCDGKRLCFPLM